MLHSNSKIHLVSRNTRGEIFMVDTLRSANEKLWKHTLFRYHDWLYDTLTSPEPSSGNCILACFDLSCSEEASKAFTSMFAAMKWEIQRVLDTKQLKKSYIQKYMEIALGCHMPPPYDFTEFTKYQVCF